MMFLKEKLKVITFLFSFLKQNVLSLRYANVNQSNHIVITLNLDEVVHDAFSPAYSKFVARHAQLQQPITTLLHTKQIF